MILICVTPQKFMGWKLVSNDIMFRSVGGDSIMTTLTTLHISYHICDILHIIYISCIENMKSNWINRNSLSWSIHMEKVYTEVYIWRKDELVGKLGKLNFTKESYHTMEMSHCDYMSPVNSSIWKSLNYS